jgi:hypothetical protein
MEEKAAVFANRVKVKKAKRRANGIERIPK